MNHLPAWARLLPRPAPLRPRVRAVVQDLWAQIAARPRYAGPILSEGLRAARILGSKERPIAGDTLLGLIRHRQALARLDPDPLLAWDQLCAPPGEPAPVDSRVLEPDPDDPAMAYALALSLPPELGAEWWRRLGPDRAWELAHTLCERAPVVLRLLSPPRALPPHRVLGPHTVVLESRTNLDLLEDYREGRVIVQDAGSQTIVDRAFPGVGARVLDLCAGAGGKALALAALGASVQAWDRRPSALQELSRRAARAGLAESSPSGPGRRGAPPPGRLRVGPPSGRYDLVLVDAPCSGSGVLRRHPENRTRLEAPTAAQREVLAQALTLGDHVIYATCALREAENEALVREFGVPLWEETLWPDAVREGFYLAKLR